MRENKNRKPIAKLKTRSHKRKLKLEANSEIEN
jgi:hypothetical protein